MRLRVLVAESLILLLSLGAAQLSAQTGSATSERSFSDSRQLLLVTTHDWSDFHGTAQRYELSRQTGKWHTVGASFPVSVGKTGLAWGRGLRSPDSASEDAPMKKEGDGKAPAGIFLLGPAFGYAQTPLSKSRLSYFAITQSSECVDDSRSSHYNEILDNRNVEKDWNTSEMMLRKDDLYRTGVVVAHNVNPAKPGSGSCIFLHIWRGQGHPTAGCTAMKQARIESLIRWLDPSKHPVLVQLPEDEYRRLRCKWRLPGPCDEHWE